MLGLPTDCSISARPTLQEECEEQRSLLEGSAEWRLCWLSRNTTYHKVWVGRRSSQWRTLHMQTRN